MHKIKVTVKCRGLDEIIKIVRADDLSEAMDIVQNQMESDGFIVDFLNASYT